MDIPQNKVLADILLMRSPSDIDYCRGISGSISVDCPCGGKAYALYYDWEVYSFFLEEPYCENCGWMDDKMKVPYPRNGN